MALSKRLKKRIARASRGNVAAAILGEKMHDQIEPLLPEQMRQELASMTPERRKELASMVGPILSDRIVTKGIGLRFSEICPRDYDAPELAVGSIEDGASVILAEQLKQLPFENLAMFRGRRRRGRANPR